MVVVHTTPVPLDLTPFDFTPTESLVYGVLVTRGPGTGYAVARTAGLARANAYAALAGLVSKGAARVEEGRPKRYRPEPAAVLLARIVDRQGHSIDALAQALDEISVPPSPTLTPISSLRGVAQLLGIEVARARVSVRLVLPDEVYTSIAPALRRVSGLDTDLELYSDGPTSGLVSDVQVVEVTDRWPGRPLLGVIDDRLALLGALEGSEASGHWTTSPTLVAAANQAISALSGAG
ncbi:MAG: TrmB family transcriptional regulator [Gemmatimonadales bacterium]|nr:MAG: TrmB family transcriptional regulator [Gemmatimonadales bacterium]